MAGDWSAVAEVINVRLANLGWTQQELSARSNVSVATIHQLQNDTQTTRRRNPRTLSALSQALGLPSTYLAQVADGLEPDDIANSPDSTSVELATIKESLADVYSRLDAIEQRLDREQQARGADPG